MPSLADLTAHLTRPVSLILATTGPDGAPTIVRCAAARLGEDGLLRVAVAMPEGLESLANVEGNGLVALTAALPSDYKTLQVKGRDARRIEWSEAEMTTVAHRAAFQEHLSTLGVGHTIAARLWSTRFESIAFTPGDVHDQTPGAKHR